MFLCSSYFTCVYNILKNSKAKKKHLSQEQIWTLFTLQTLLYIPGLFFVGFVYQLAEDGMQIFWRVISCTCNIIRRKNFRHTRSSRSWHHSKCRIVLWWLLMGALLYKKEEILCSLLTCLVVSFKDLCAHFDDVSSTRGMCLYFELAKYKIWTE